MMARLLYHDDQGREASVLVPTDGAYLGRAPDCLVHTDDVTVSRRNCRLILIDGCWSLEDLDSVNGTYVNGQRVAQLQALRDGDVVQCGALVVRFFLGADGQTAPQPAAPPEAPAAAPGEQEEPSFEELAQARQEARAAREALALLRRQHLQAEAELSTQRSVTSELRGELKLAKGQVAQSKVLLEDLRLQVEGKDRMLQAAGEDIRRLKQGADASSLKLQELTSARDELLGALNQQREDTERLREVLKTREQMIEEGRAGLLLLEGRLADLRRRAEQAESDLGRARAERDALRERPRQPRC